MTLPKTLFGNKEKKFFISSLHKRLSGEFKKGQMGYSSIAIIGQSCLGSVAAMVLLIGEMTMSIKMTLLFLVTILCMAFNGAVLAQLKSLTTFNLLILSVVFSTLVILLHFAYFF
tara:strand:- start:648 stop:992 length:345 start_codon:yes stop_codon:yes gene_type:complete